MWAYLINANQDFSSTKLSATKAKSFQIFHKYC